MKMNYFSCYLAHRFVLPVSPLAQVQRDVIPSSFTQKVQSPQRDKRS